MCDSSTILFVLRSSEAGVAVKEEGREEWRGWNRQEAASEVQLVVREVKPGGELLGGVWSSRKGEEMFADDSVNKVSEGHSTEHVPPPRGERGAELKGGGAPGGQTPRGAEEGLKVERLEEDEGRAGRLQRVRSEETLGRTSGDGGQVSRGLWQLQQAGSGAGGGTQQPDTRLKEMSPEQKMVLPGRRRRFLPPPGTQQQPEWCRRRRSAGQPEGPRPQEGGGSDACRQFCFLVVKQ